MIGKRQIGSDHPPYIIAELGVNHDGLVDRAIELVHAAKHAGADAIKLQFFQTDRLLSRGSKLAGYQEQSGARDPFKMLRRLELAFQQIKQVVHAARQAQLHAIVTVFSVELVKEAGSLPWDAYKIASPDLINRPLIEALMRARLPMLISTGAATLQEVLMTREWLGDHPHAFMQCVSAYPAPDRFSCLRGRIAMCDAGLEALGYSDHTTAIDTGALAVASGACILEKHLTHSRSAIGPDHAASLDPSQFAQYVRLAHRAHEMMGDLCKDVLDIERDVRCVSRQSITASKDMTAGHVIAQADVTIKRPGVGITPALMNDVVGRRVRIAIAADTPICQEHLA